MHDMWEQLNDPHYSASMRLSADAALDCGDDADACWGPGPPPEFRLPPPPRPPFLQELAGGAGGLKCTEDPLPDIEMCRALPAVSSLAFIQF